MKQGKITNRILVPLAFALIGLCTIVVLSILWLEKQHIETSDHESFNATIRMFQLEINDDAAFMRSIINTIIYNEEMETNLEKSLKTALISNDEVALLAYSQDLYEELRKEHDITHFYFHSPERVNILRVHQPERNGDIISRTTAKQSEEKKTPVHGIELGPLGTFTLRVVVPWYDGGKLLGYIELGKEIDSIVEYVSNLNNVGITVAIEKKFLNKKTWMAGMEMLGRTGRVEHSRQYDCRQRYDEV